MKGITPIIAIIILLLITVAIAGAAYTYMSGYWGGLTGKVIQATGFCTGGTKATVVVTNIGTTTVSVGGCTGAGSVTGASTQCDDVRVFRTDGGTMSGNFSAASIASKKDVVFEDTTCTTAGTAKICTYEFTTPGMVAPAEATIECSG